MLYLLSFMLMFISQSLEWKVGVTDSGIGQVKPSLTNCSVRSIRLLQHTCSVMHNVTLQWRMAEDVLNEISNYYFYCNCHNYETGVTKMHIPNQCTASLCLPIQYSFGLSVDTCLDQCECQVYAKPQGGGFFNNYWSNACSFSIGPSVPLASPNFSQPVIKVAETMSVQVFFKLPSLETCYCDNDLIKSISVYVLYNSSKFMKYDINNDNIAKINDTYKFILLLDSFYFWNTVKLSISVNNSIGASPYSDYYTIKGAINCDIMPGTYWLKYENLTSVSVTFYWKLSDLLVSLLESGFITGSRYQLMFLNGTVIESDITNNINFTLNNLISGQWYFICVSLSTTDISWPPDSCLNFKTKQDTKDWETAQSNESNDDEKIIWIVFPILSCIVVIFVIFTLCLKPYCFKEHEISSPRETPEVSVSIGDTFTKHESSDIESVPTYNQDDSSSCHETNNAIPDTDTTLM